MRYQLWLRDSFKKKLELIQEFPDKGFKFPTVVLVPGFGMDFHEYGYFDDVSNILVGNGIQTFRFSFEGTGKSEGDFKLMTLNSQVRQLKDVLEYVLKDRFTKRTRVGILAQSFGTVTVISALPIANVKTLVFTSTPVDPFTSLSKRFKRQRGFQPDGISEIERSDKRKTRIGSQFWKSLTRFDPYAKVKDLNKSLLLIHGSKDKFIPVGQVEEYYSTITSEKRLHIIEKADHGFTGKYRTPVIKLISEWFLKQL